MQTDLDAHGRFVGPRCVPAYGGLTVRPGIAGTMHIVGVRPLAGARTGLPSRPEHMGFGHGR